jgi:DNA-binding NtrC family response regulator
VPAKGETDSQDVVGEDNTRRSGVRAKQALRVLVVEPQNYVREHLEANAPADRVRFLMTATPDEAARLRAEERVDCVACSFPLPGAEKLIRALRHERFPVLVMTSEARRAIHAFGLGVPVLEQPVELEQLLEAIEQLVTVDESPPEPAIDRAPASTAAIVEIPPPPNPRDPRRE